jgi:hypothetical protein
VTSIAKLTGLVVALVALVSPVHAAEGVLIVERTTTGDSTRSNQIQIEAQRMRAEMTDADGRAQVVVFDGAKQVLWLIDSSRKSYSEMTKADVDRMGGQMSAAMAKMQEQLKSLPPAQRAQFEAMMKGRGMPGMAAAAPRTEYRRAGTDKAGRWSCLKYEGFQNGEKTSEVCTVEPKELGFTQADFAVSRQLAEFFRSLMPQSSDVFAIGTPEEQGFSGVPVRRVSRLGPRQTVTEIVEIKRDTFPDSLFAVPEGFTRQAMPGAPGR